MATQLKHRASAPLLAEAPTASAVTVSATSAAKIAASTRPPVVLTRRERKVKGILLKELAKVNGQALAATGLSYAERQHLEKNLSVAYLNAEIEKMRRRLAASPRLLFWTALLFGAAMLGISLGTGEPGEALLDVAIVLAYMIPSIITGVVFYRAERRKLFIYEALRELTDADEADVLLSDATRDADVLIQRIVERELEADARYSLAQSN